MSDERYSAEVSVKITNLTTGAEEWFGCDRTGDMSRAGLAKWIAIVAPIGPSLNALNAQFLSADLTP